MLGAIRTAGSMTNRGTSSLGAFHFAQEGGWPLFCPATEDAP